MRIAATTELDKVSKLVMAEQSPQTRPHLVQMAPSGSDVAEILPFGGHYSGRHRVQPSYGRGPVVLCVHRPFGAERVFGYRQRKGTRLHCDEGSRFALRAQSELPEQALVAGCDTTAVNRISRRVAPVIPGIPKTHLR